MEISGYHLDIEPILQLLKKKRYNTIALQIPEGLKTNASTIADFIKTQTNADIIIIADPCYGACDIPENKLSDLKVDCIVHIGHLIIPHNKTTIPTFFINAEFNRDITEAVTKAIPLLEGKKIGIVTTAQHIHTIQKIQQILQNRGFTPYIGKGDNRIAAEGQILGCNFTAALAIMNKVDSFLLVGSGTFHALGLLLSSKKPVIAADPYTSNVKRTEIEELKKTILKQRYGAIARSKDAEEFGILIGLKQGQQRIQQAYEIKKLLDKKKKKSYFLALELFSPSSLLGFSNIDCFISMGCPRIAIDDYLQYKKPIITPVELKILLDEIQWDDYEFDQFISDK